MFMTIISWVMSGLPGVAEKLLDIWSKKVDANVQTNATNVGADVQVNLAVIQGKIEEQKLAAAARAADRGSLWTAWMMPALFGITLTHYAAIVFDSEILFGHVVGSWRIPALPGNFAGMEPTILLSVIGIVQGKAIVGRIFSK